MRSAQTKKSASHPSNRRLRRRRKRRVACPVDKPLGLVLESSARHHRGRVNNASKNGSPWLERRLAGRADDPLLLAQPASSGQGATAAVGGMNEKLMSTAWAEWTQAMAEIRRGMMRLLSGELRVWCGSGWMAHGHNQASKPKSCVPEAPLQGPLHIIGKSSGW